MGTVTTPVGGSGNDGWELVKDGTGSRDNNNYGYMSGFITMNDVMASLNGWKADGYNHLKFVWTATSGSTIMYLATSNEYFISDLIEAIPFSALINTGASMMTFNSMMDSYLQLEPGSLNLRIANCNSIGWRTSLAFKYKIYAHK